MQKKSCCLERKTSLPLIFILLGVMILSAGLGGENYPVPFPPPHHLRTPTEKTANSEKSPQGKKGPRVRLPWKRSGSTPQDFSLSGGRNNDDSVQLLLPKPDLETIHPSSMGDLTWSSSQLPRRSFPVSDLQNHIWWYQISKLRDPCGKRGG